MEIPLAPPLQSEIAWNGQSGNANGRTSGQLSSKRCARESGPLQIEDEASSIVRSDNPCKAYCTCPLLLVACVSTSKSRSSSRFGQRSTTAMSSRREVTTRNFPSLRRFWRGVCTRRNVQHKIRQFGRPFRKVIAGFRLPAVGDDGFLAVDGSETRQRRLVDPVTRIRA